jgi:hypothetical protein
MRDNGAVGGFAGHLIDNLEVVVSWSCTFEVRIQASRELSTWFNNAKRDGGALLARAGALLSVLRDLPARPTMETATLKRVRQATRHEIWRVAHPFDPAVAVRILCWFPDDDTAVVALIGGHKAGISDVWYDSATRRAEAEVDQWLREQQREENR